MERCLLTNLEILIIKLGLVALQFLKVFNLKECICGLKPWLRLGGKGFSILCNQENQINPGQEQIREQL
jgi:hypothetical protein